MILRLKSPNLLMKILDVKNLNVSFRVNGKIKTILQDISFGVDEQQTLGIVGESGSGKSVTAMSILKLISTPPLADMSGEVLYQGRNLLPLSNTEMRELRGKEIGFIFQEPMTALNPVFTIGDQISETIMAHEAIGKKEALNRGIELLDEVGIPRPGLRMKSYPHELSGGMRQRALAAIALSCNPRLLIADEPTTALDVTIQAQVLELFKRLKRERQMSIIFITHDLRVIAEIADHVLVMHQGKCVEKNTVNTIFHSPEHHYTQKLLSLVSDRRGYGRA